MKSSARTRSKAASNTRGGWLRNGAGPRPTGSRRAPQPSIGRARDRRGTGASRARAEGTQHAEPGARSHPGRERTVVRRRVEARGPAVRRVARDAGIARPAPRVLRRARLWSRPRHRGAPGRGRGYWPRRRHRRRHHGLGHRDGAGRRRHPGCADRTRTRRARSRPRHRSATTMRSPCNAAASTRRRRAPDRH